MQSKPLKVVIMAGGQGTRCREETEYRLKPMVQIGTNPIERLMTDNELMMYPHEGFWQFCDTYREPEFLNTSWSIPNPPWNVWQ